MSANARLFTRIAARRNFAGFPFWVSATPATCATLAERARACAASRGFDAGTLLASLSPEEIGVLRERMKLPERPSSFPGKRDFKMLFRARGEKSDENSPHALFGEAEHWIEIRTVPMGEPAEETARILELELNRDRNDTSDGRDGSLLFSQSPEWGFLTSDPAFAGTGLQWEAGLHLPALAASRGNSQIAQMQRAMAATGFELQPLSLRAPGAAEAGFFRLLSRGGLGLSGPELLASFEHKVDRLIAAETKAWEMWSARDAVGLEDRMHRAMKVLQEARLLEYAEMLTLVSYARAGVRAGIFPASRLPLLEELRVRAQPFHLRVRPSAPARTNAGAHSGRNGTGEAESRAALARRLLNTP
jgi:hypothetical protein